MLGCLQHIDLMLQLLVLLLEILQSLVQWGHFLLSTGAQLFNDLRRSSVFSRISRNF